MLSWPVTARRLCVLLLALIAACLPAASASASDGVYKETSGPADAPAAVLFLHGGGWGMVGAAAVIVHRPYAGRYANQFLTVSSSYRPRSQSVPDALAAYDELRASVGPDMPICTAGVSAGGHLALVVAQHRDVACVVSEGGPTDLLHPGSTLLSQLIHEAFGYDIGQLTAVSPLAAAGAMNVPLLLVHARNDPLVPLAHAQSMAATAPHAELVVLDDGPANWVHRQVDPTQLDAAVDREVQFIADRAAAWSAARQPVPPAQTTPSPAPAPAATPPARQDPDHRKAARRSCKQRSRRARNRCETRQDRRQAARRHKHRRAA